MEVEVEVEVEVAGDQKKNEAGSCPRHLQKTVPLELTPFGELRKLKNAAALSAFPV